MQVWTVEGPTLTPCGERGPIPAEEAVKIRVPFLDPTMNTKILLRVEKEKKRNETRMMSLVMKGVVPHLSRHARFVCGMPPNLVPCWHPWTLQTMIEQISTASFGLRTIFECRGVVAWTTPARLLFRRYTKPEL
jgi:hypothetical protein